MTIDWFTVVAQFVNFFVLLWLLKYFLYEPITNAIDTREQRIQERFEEADRREDEARSEKEELENRQEELARERKDILDEAREEAAHRKEELIQEARTEADRLRERWKREIDREKEQFLRELRQKTTETLQDQAKRILETLADTTLTEQIAETFLDRLQELTEDELDEFRESLRMADGVLTVESSCELSELQEDRVFRELETVFGPEYEVEFKVDRSLIAGIELSGGGRKIGWNVRDVLDRVERSVETKLEEELVSGASERSFSGSGSSVE